MVGKRIDIVDRNTRLIGKYMYMMYKNRRMVGRNIKIVDKGNMVGKDIKAVPWDDINFRF